MPFDVAQAFQGKRILFTGATGFVGKVTLSMLLHHYGDSLNQIYVLARKGSGLSAEQRFFDKIVTSEPFQPLRDRHGDQGALRYFRSKCTVLDGDITDQGLGLAPEKVESLRGRIDGVMNCAGLVSFNPSLEVGLHVNTVGVKHMVDLCLQWNVPLIHMSTAFVAGNRNGLVFEDEEVNGYFPRKKELDGRDFSLQQELLDCEKLVARLREKADDKALQSIFRQKALERLAEEGRNADDEKTMRLAVGRERKLWLSTELTQAGMERARHWGWPNTYTYTKSLGEQVIAQANGLRYAIVRPSIVESAWRYPFPGWNEGFTTSAPLAFAGIKGHRSVPASSEAILDIIPVDLVAGAFIGIAARNLVHPEQRVYQLASGDANPFMASRSVELVGLYRRRFYRHKDTGSPLLNRLKSHLEPQAVSKKAFQLRSAPLFLKGSRLLRKALHDFEPGWGAPRVSALISKATEKLEAVELQATSLSWMIELFLPFIWENRYVFRCDNTRQMFESLAPADQEKIPWDPEKLDWRRYFLETHLPGLEKWVFPGLEEETRRRTAVHAHRDLLELFEASTHAHRHRVAFRMVSGEREERFTYGEVHRYANRVGTFLLSAGVGLGDKVLIISENRPEWGIVFFGILKSGATAVPVDPQLSETEMVNLARASHAKACILSEKALADLPGLSHSLRAAGLSTQIYGLAQSMADEGPLPSHAHAAKKTAAPDDVASLIFTSGTTGQPKGVMLTHRNFASLISKLAGVFDIRVGDGLLSVLPLHHTFEFSCGFLLPFSRGAEISYIDELTSDRLGEVLETGRITAMIGVPAVWQLFHRRMTQEMTAKPGWVKQSMRLMMGAHAEFRNRTEINLGKLLFWPVHRKLGGKLKFMVSGGSALPDEVHKAFHALGFNISEGYGLTEAAPVLSVAESSHRRLPGTVGKALPGIEIKIDQPDSQGIGEVLARGPNVMAGYFENREATEAILKNGWLSTGDLGRLDEESRLYLVGRQKDLIIDKDGRNVFPDELEELYAGHPSVRELSVIGLPDETGGEKVACLCVPVSSSEEVRRELEDHFRKVSAEIPFYRRIKILHFWEGELPRTSTRKVKRPWVIDQLKKLEHLSQTGHKLRSTPDNSDQNQWLFALIAEVARKPLNQVNLQTRLSTDLGLDSLSLTELSSALEQRGIPLPVISDLTQIETVSDLSALIGRSTRKATSEAKSSLKAEDVPAGSSEIPVPDLIAKAGRSLLAIGQRALYEGFFDVAVSGKNFIPQNRNFLVISNHVSHLDMGLVKVVLGDQGERLSALAARDYFFDTPLKRAYFENFTNLIPMDRHGSLRESLQLAGQALRQGYNLLIFPEGTRSQSGQLLEFKPTLGYLSLTYQIDILPLYLEGTYEALPKGALIPKAKKLAVRIGVPLRYEDMKRETVGMARSASYRWVTQKSEQAVRLLRGVEQPANFIPPKSPEPEPVS